MARPPDVRRMGAAMSRPGNDPRIWSCCARVESEGVRWHPTLGWVVDVETYGSRVDGETDVTARMMSAAGGDGTGEYLPVEVGAEVVLQICGGSLEENPVILGYCTNSVDATAPTEVHGLPIDGERETSSEFRVSPFDTEIKVSKWNRREQFDGAFERRSQKSRVEATEKAALVAPSVLLGGDSATEPYVLGNSHNTALVAAIEAIELHLTTLTTALAGLLPSGVVVNSSLGQMKQTLTAQKQAIKQALSQKIKGE